MFDVKHDECHKAWMVADGHLTVIPIDSIYSGVVSVHGTTIIIFLAKLNGLKTWSTDIGNVYLKALMKEKLYIIARPEFGPMEGHTLVIHKALYGLCSSGACWHNCFTNYLCEIVSHLSRPNLIFG